MSGCAAHYLLEKVRGTEQAQTSVQRLVDKLKVVMFQWSKSQSNPLSNLQIVWDLLFPSLAEWLCTPQPLLANLNLLTRTWCGDANANSTHPGACMRVLW